MRRWLPRRHSRVAGFTLVEALVATLLMGVVLTALATVTAQWLPSWNRGFDRVQRTELLSVAIDRIAADLAAAEFISPFRQSSRPLFEGTGLSVTFVRSAIGPNTQPGLEIVRIAETADGRGAALVRSKAVFTPLVAGAPPPRFSDPVVLLRVPYRASFSYAGQDGVWKDRWVDARELPSAVRLVIRDAGTGRTLPVSTATLIRTQIPAACVKSSDCRGAEPDSRAADAGQAREPGGTRR
jgi:general secretion pathway protein J